jgi:anaerobic dimethyl sulfoxide reductase subunit C
MRERSLVAFTLLAQTAVGLTWALAAVGVALGNSVGVALRAPFLAVGPLMGAAALISLLHLGSPRNAWRALGNLRSSWLSREILFLALFFAGWAAAALPMVVGPGPASLRLPLLGGVAVLGVGLLLSMAQVYRLRTVPAWDTPRTTAAFLLTTVTLGTLTAALALGLAAGPVVAVRGLGLVATSALAGELWLEAGWRAPRRRAAPRAPRVTLLLLALALAAGVFVGTPGAGHPAWAWAWAGSALAVALAAAVVGRAAFYGSYARLGV